MSYNARCANCSWRGDSSDAVDRLGQEQYICPYCRGTNIHLVSDASDRGFIPGRTPNGEYVAIPVFFINQHWRNANGLVDECEAIYLTEFEAINAAHKYYKKGKKR